MKRKHYLFLVCYFLLAQANAQTANWVWDKFSQLTDTSVSVGISIATDKADNVYITGNFGGAISFGSDTITSSNGAFLAKYDANGNALWAKGSLGGPALGLGVITDDAGNIYITGFFYASVAFDSYTLPFAGDADVFVVKYDTAGNVLWAKSGGGIGHDGGLALTMDHLNNLYVTGLNGSAVFVLGSDTIRVGTNFNGKCFLAKYDTSGNALWVKSVVGGGGNSIAADLSNNIYIANDSIGGVVLTKYDYNGNQLWYETADTGVATGVATDAFNNVYITGWISSASIKFGSITLTNAGGGDAFFVKYDSSGNVVWAKNIGGTGTERGWAVTTDSHKNVYLTGGFTSASLTFDTITITQPPGSVDPMFIAGYDTSGRINFVKSLPSGGESHNSVAVSSSSSCIYIGGGYIRDTIVAGNDTLVRGTGFEMAFVAKLCSSDLSAGFSSSNTSICNDGCIAFYDNSTGFPTAWQWSFPGALPSSSSQQNPASVCYTDTGYHDVTFIVSDGGIPDTVKFTNFIHVEAIPPTPTLTQKGDSLISTTDSSYILYQWYADSVLIPNATNNYYVIHQNGNYNLSVRNANGCVTSVGIIINGIANISIADFNIYPNPATQQLMLTGLPSHGDKITLQVFNVLGSELYNIKVVGREVAIDVSSFPQGVYYIRLEGDGESAMRKFIKE